jgi:hypothetical protein
MCTGLANQILMNSFLRGTFHDIVLRFLPFGALLGMGLGLGAIWFVPKYVYNDPPGALTISAVMARYPVLRDTPLFADRKNGQAAQKRRRLTDYLMIAKTNPDDVKKAATKFGLVGFGSNESFDLESWRSKYGNALEKALPATVGSPLVYTGDIAGAGGVLMVIDTANNTVYFELHETAR